MFKVESNWRGRLMKKKRNKTGQLMLSRKDFEIALAEYIHLILETEDIKKLSTHCISKESGLSALRKQIDAYLLSIGQCAVRGYKVLLCELSKTFHLTNDGIV
jgi:hypothetical protein